MTDLILGTAQFGSAYGITNTVGRIEDSEIARILESAAEAGIREFDTAADYGDSQLRLGNLSPRGSRFITKFHLPDDGSAPTKANLYEDSLRQLRADSLSAVMFHKVSDLADERVVQTIEILEDARVNGLIERAGVSIYDADDLDLALRSFPGLSIVQILANVLDRRLLDLPRLADLRAGGVTVHVRSAFLQGVLLGGIPGEHFSPLAPELDRLRAIAQSRGLSLAGLALGFLRDHPVVDGVVVGVTTEQELAGIAAGWAEPAVGDVGSAPALPIELLDPRHWPRNPA